MARQIADCFFALLLSCCACDQVRLPRKYTIRMPRPEKDSKEGYCNDAYAAPLWEDGGVRGYDMVLFLTANHTKDCKQGALAYTLPCLTDMVTGRPTAAGMNVCPLSQRSSASRLLNTLVHEMVHGLVSGAAWCLGGHLVALSFGVVNSGCEICRGSFEPATCCCNPART